MSAPTSPLDQALANTPTQAELCLLPHPSWTGVSQYPSQVGDVLEKQPAKVIIMLLQRADVSPIAPL